MANNASARCALGWSERFRKSSNVRQLMHKGMIHEMRAMNYV